MQNGKISPVFDMYDVKLVSRMHILTNSWLKNRCPIVFFEFAFLEPFETHFTAILAYFWPNFIDFLIFLPIFMSNIWFKTLQMTISDQYTWIYVDRMSFRNNLDLKNMEILKITSFYRILAYFSVFSVFLYFRGLDYS